MILKAWNRARPVNIFFLFTFIVLEKMAALEMPHHHIVDIDVGGATSVVAAEVEENGGSYSDADDGGSCNSHEFHSTVTYDDYCFSSEIFADEGFDSSDGEKKVLQPSSADRDCRICHLSLLSSSPGRGIAIELGCSCKDDLASAHKHCAETWFKIKGNKTCEICNSIVRNIVGQNDVEDLQQVHEVNAIADNNTTLGAENPSCFNGHRLVNFLLACTVFAFVISWLFHFNIPS